MVYYKNTLISYSMFVLPLARTILAKARTHCTLTHILQIETVFALAIVYNASKLLLLI